MADMTGTSDTRPPNILVCVKFVPDPNQLQADASGHPDLARAPFRISTFDENAIEAALQLSTRHGGHIFGVSVTSGQVPPRDVLLRTLAMGVEVLYLIKDEARLAADPYRVAAVLAAAARAIQSAENIPSWDLVIAGEASADQFNAQIGPRVAMALDLPAIAYATKLELQHGRLIANRATDERSETLEVDLPALVTVGTEINQARMPTVLQVMGAARKPIREIVIEELPGIDLDALERRPSLRTIDISAPPSARKRIVIEGQDAAEMASHLLSRLGTDGEVKF
ncbi:MAG: electron transfer flavoprotein beta subunit/FixA family protein [Beijerinckiaceae bacterium]|nr:MAG: electron transfer flavoprotein beta subunit/FixA family protein [Beijerinckiaceae bacterium]